MSRFPIIDKLGGHTVVCDYLRDECDISKPRDTLRVWHQRRRISDKGHRLLESLARREGILVTDADFKLTLQSDDEQSES